jgi:hypothetical protein
MDVRSGGTQDIDSCLFALWDKLSHHATAHHVIYTFEALMSKKAIAVATQQNNAELPVEESRLIKSTHVAYFQARRNCYRVNHK